MSTKKMAPTPEDDNANPPTIDINNHVDVKFSHPAPGEEIVISGIGGRFPDSDNIDELQKNLLNGVDMVSDNESRWKRFHPEIPQATGKISKLDRFDASFFGVHFKQAETMDPMCRQLLECTYTAVIDAGINPKALRNTKTAVFVGASLVESEKTWFYEKIQFNGFGLTGCSKAMLANRISYWFGTTGPSYTLDASDASASIALDHAFKSLTLGYCDMAIVGAVNLCLHPYISLQYSRLGILSPEGKCRCFDEKAQGHVRADTVSAILLQKAKDARRVYSQIVHVKSSYDGYRQDKIVEPSTIALRTLIKEFYEECKVNPASVEFLEAHATGIAKIDGIELDLIEEIFCKNRQTPLKIGSVKSNLGHAETASGMCALAKMCVAYDSGMLPGNLHYKTPRDNKALRDGRLEVVTKTTKWNKGLSAITTIGMTGCNVHILLKNYAKNKIDSGLPKDTLPRLVCISARTESAIKRIQQKIEENPIDVEHISLLHTIHERDIPGHVFRGYIALRPFAKDKVACKEVTYFPGTKRPIWFIFSGMGSQWPGMGKDLMEIPIFRKAIMKCDKVLRPKGVDIVKVLTDPDPKIFDYIVNCFVGIAAVQIGLFDILREIEIKPDFILGHSVGELGCGYADGCFTAEQMILAAYYRGLASSETILVKGSMAAVGLGYNEMKKHVTSEIDIACHNGPESTTISGPSEAMQTFVSSLQSRGIFAKEVPCSNIAYHSRYIAKAGPTLLKYLKEIIPHPKKRSPKWISSSIPKHRWEEDIALYSSAEYHTNNLLSPVLFEESSKLVSYNAITIEIAPHGLLQAILRKSLKKDCTSIGLTKRGHANNMEFLLNSIGTLYEAGVNPQLKNLYPKVEWPVSATTPKISPMVEWSHEDSWYVTGYAGEEKISAAERTIRLTTADEDTEYITGHMIDGRTLYPMSGYLYIIWETFSKVVEKNLNEMSVVFEDIEFSKQTPLEKTDELELLVMIQKGSGQFEISEGKNTIVTGCIRESQFEDDDFAPLSEITDLSNSSNDIMNTDDVYKEFSLRGFNYSGAFKSIKQRHTNGKTGNIRWINNWVTFLDALIQMQMLTIDSRDPVFPSKIKRVSIDAPKHYESCPGGFNEEILPVTLCQNIGVVRSGGVEVRGLGTHPITRKNCREKVVLEERKFVPYFPKYEMKFEDVVRCYSQIIMENVDFKKVKAIEYFERLENNDAPLMPLFMKSIEDISLTEVEAFVICDEAINLGPKITVNPDQLFVGSSADVFIASNLIERLDILKKTLECLKEDGFLITLEKSSTVSRQLVDEVDFIGRVSMQSDNLVLLRKRVKNKPINNIDVSSPGWMGKMTHHLNDGKRQLLVSQNDDFGNGLPNLIDDLKKQTIGADIGCVVIMDKQAPPFNTETPIYKDQLKKNLAVNILKNGQWGTCRYLKIDDNRTVSAKHAYANPTLIRDISSLKWLQGPLNNKQENLVHVYYASINLDDVSYVVGKLTQNIKSRLEEKHMIGLEYAGRTEKGNRVMGIVKSRAIANILVPDQELQWSVPEDWSIEDAVTVPFVYSLVYQAFFVLCSLKRGSKVLIHNGASAVGQAAINVCSYYECEIYTTAETKEKVTFLKQTYPQIKESRLCSSADTSFTETIMNETQGTGVQYVFSMLGDDKLDASIKCLGYRGQFIDIGRFLCNSNVGMEFFLRECSMKAIIVSNLFDDDPQLKKKLNTLVSEGIKNGCVRPIVIRKTFQTNNIEKGFRYAISRNHVGKVLVKIRDEEPNKNHKPSSLTLEAIPRYFCNPDKTYIVIGGLSDLGLELVDWLILRGARKIIINTEHGISNGFQSSRLRIWKSYGIDINISILDISTETGSEQLLKKSQSLAPVTAIFDLSVFEKDSEDNSATCKLLDIKSRKFCGEIRNFVIFSRSTYGMNSCLAHKYSVLNTSIESVSEERQKADLPVLVVQWPALEEIGDEEDACMDLATTGMAKQKVSSCLKCLDVLLTSSSQTIVTSKVLVEKKSDKCNRTGIAETLASILDLDNLVNVPENVTFEELGIDSIMLAEIQHCLEKDHGLYLTAKDISNLMISRVLEISSANKCAEIINKDEQTEKLSSIKVMMKNLVCDELTAATDILNVATLSCNDYWLIPANDTDPRVFVIPGIEGIAPQYENICKKIKCNATVLQLGYESPDESIQDIARRLFGFVHPVLRPQEPFILLAYSFGVAVAIEMLHIMEDAGFFGTLICLNGSPEMVQSLVRSEFKSEDENKIQDGIIDRLYAIANHDEGNSIRSELECLKSLDDKFNAFLKHLPIRIKFTKQYLKTVVKTLTGRMKLILNNYKVSNSVPLRSQCILLRPKNLDGLSVSNDYGLNNYFKSRVQVYMLDSSHNNILEDTFCFRTVNKVVLENERNKRNLIK